MRELSEEEPYLDKNNELVQQQKQHPIKAKDVQTDSQQMNPRLFSKIHLTNSTSPVKFQHRIRDPSTGGFVGKRNGFLLDQALLNAIEMERLKKENKYLRELLGISGDFDHQNGSSNESRMNEQELHLAKLKSVVSEVIKKEEEQKEEEEEDDNDNEHLEEQHEGPYYIEEEENIIAWQTASCKVDQDEHSEISKKHGDANEQTHLDQDLSPLSVAKLSKWVKPPVIRILPFCLYKISFDIFLQSMIACLQDGSFLPVTMPGGSHFENSLKTPRVLVKKVLVLGSGGLSIGQALSDKTGNLAEIDYSMAEALAVRTILEEGYDIRLSGQDSGQGAFSQRHALLTDQVVEGRTIVPLNQLLAKNSQ
ncbi:hypothetical protein BY996DRAFT_6522708 [Phakopsora pachyrhizi]|nr:hypothetical protein BY996DRAFT_6522708 [Phakopsora pachyrhizi]